MRYFISDEKGTQLLEITEAFKNSSSIGTQTILDFKVLPRVALCVGHNRISQGAYGNAGITEYVFNSEFVAELAILLEGIVDFKVFHREPKPTYEEEQEVLHRRIAEWKGCTLAVEFHFNSATNEDITGHEILYFSPKGRLLALKLDKQFDRLSNKDRNIKLRDKGAGTGFLRRGNYPCLIVEPFFASHQSNFLPNSVQRNLLLQAYVDFFGRL